jgi:hypothetical protein
MILPDINLLLYAYVDSFPLHLPARRWWEDVLSDDQPIALSWHVLTGFVRLITNRRVLHRPAGISDALAYVDQWLKIPPVKIIAPGMSHYSIFRPLVDMTPGGDMVHDAHLAALAIEHNATLHSNDTDFSRFPGLKWHNPLAKPKSLR